MHAVKIAEEAMPPDRKVAIEQGVGVFGPGADPGQNV